MSDTVISAKGLGKSYLIGHKREQAGTFRDRIVESIGGLRRNVGRTLRGEQLLAGESIEEFWALKDVGFEIGRGEAVGIIGRNGAGKSTLLKILSRITEPTTGRVEIKGRVASLLEVGTGFHPELTGRENIYLNGAILGMTRAEIRRRFDEIVDFAGVERFLDTPVKRYSSGMYVRLAFAVAAHLEPEILVVDEVLAVGDAEFQKKCLGKMQDVAGSGRTIIFVSHNMNAIERLCSRAILLQTGKISNDSLNVQCVTEKYLSGEGQNLPTAWSFDGFCEAHSAAEFLSFFICDVDGNPLRSSLSNDSDIKVRAVVDIKTKDPSFNVGLAVYHESGELIFWSQSTDGPEKTWPVPITGLTEWTCRIPRRLLNEGVHRVELMASLHKKEWIVMPGGNGPAIFLEIRGGLSDSPHWLEKRPGIVAPELIWSRNKL